MALETASGVDERFAVSELDCVRADEGTWSLRRFLAQTRRKKGFGHWAA